jgi:hypothetical protein
LRQGLKLKVRYWTPVCNRCKRQSPREERKPRRPARMIEIEVRKK